MPTPSAEQLAKMKADTDAAAAKDLQDFALKRAQARVGKDRVSAFAADTKLSERIEADEKGLPMIRTKKLGLVPLDQWLDKQLSPGGKRSWFVNRDDADNRKTDDDLELLADEACTSLAKQGELYKRDPVKAALLLAARGLVLGQLGKLKRSGTDDHRANPFSKVGLNLTEAGRIVKMNPRMARDLIKAAGNPKWAVDLIVDTK